ncbi:hypothetical protein BASA50_002332 [Batrachochytrium salamandrivorans]|uniref:cAMP-dependent protein kinase regulatory subunit n=1 Tax=Batrachochytrium salamandrivorans TaxID=1357716 RepID=A0ABQ8FLK0_9FUNG|nr:hypothetical protein BASA60_011446 [Batrachochytrium salamandrivorans]KAH6577167.1 hypothetical protein BASA62_001003 [Batrachochytrium salamandrivorans]KAH6600398.1 hypothetical protein BASA50_002332 [Batrachochytrium salamandrivorans]KAH6602849.1 hypothetical protein BASA61_000692 [Batrachochytrium salamandrivorans]KAH9263884.1 hypothetical protein BASA83_012668 [Batrachochytrium salamandrivorans]
MSSSSANHAAPSVPADFPDILKDLNRAILRAQPADILEFCAEYFRKKTMDRQASVATAPAPANTEAFYATIQQTYTMPAGTETEPAPIQTEHEPLTDNEEDDLLPDDEDDIMDPIAHPPPPVNHNRGRRTSVSAESMVPSTDKDYVKVNIPKAAEQRKRIENAIHANFLFRSLDEEQYTDVINAMSEKPVAAGEEVIKQGGIGDYFYIVETGALDVFVARNVNGELQPAVKVTDYGPNGSFGELALMYNAPRAATVIATQDSFLWALDRVTFRRILMENTSRKRRMYELFLEEVPLLVSLEPYERHKIADALESVTFADGDCVIRQGDVGDCFYIIESGEATVTQTDGNGVDHLMHAMKKGDYFGELALLTDKPRKATISAKGRLKCASLGKKAFVRLLGPVVDIIKRNASNYETVYQKVELD